MEKPAGTSHASMDPECRAKLRRGVWNFSLILRGSQDGPLHRKIDDLGVGTGRPGGAKARVCRGYAIN